MVAGSESLAHREAELIALEGPRPAGKPHILDPSHASIPVKDRHGLKASDVRNALYAVREAVRQHMRTQLAHMTPSAQSLDREWNDLMN